MAQENKQTERTIQLKEIEVIGIKDRFVQKGDTIVINIRATDARPHASALSLFGRVEGLQEGFGGSLTMLGKSIQKVTIDNRTIFGGIGQLTLENIKADMIERMEYIETTNAAGQVQNVLNVILKKDKKNGGFGEVAVGGGISKRFNLNGKFSKISPNGFLNVFSTANNINEKGVDSKTVNRFLITNFLNSINTSSSVIGLYETPSHSFEQELENSLSDKLRGINTILNNGINYTFETDKLEFNGFIYANAIDEFSQESRAGNSFLGNSSQQSMEGVEERNRSRNITSNAYMTWRPTKQLSVRFSNQLNAGKSKINFQRNSKLLVEETSFQTFNKNERMGVNNSLENVFQVSSVMKGTKSGVVSTIYYQNKWRSFNNNVDFINSNSFSFQNQYIEREYGDMLNHIQITHSMPVNKRLLLEGKLKYSSDINKINLTTLSLLDDSNSIVYNNQTNNLFDASIYGLVKTKRLSIVSGLAYWYWGINRQFYGESVKRSRNLIISPFTNVELKLKQVTFDFNYSKRPTQPSSKETISPADSSDINNILVGNPFLDSYTDECFSLGMETGIGHGYKFSFKGSLNRYENYIIRENTFDPRVGTFGINFINSILPNKSLNLSATFFKLNINKAFTWNTSLSHSRFTIYQQSEAKLSELKSHISLMTLNAYWKVSKSLSSNIFLKSQINAINEQIQSNHSITHKLSVELGYKTNFDSELEFFLNQSSTVQNQTFLNLQMSRYFTKKNSIKASFLLQNAFNNKFLIYIQQTDNSYFLNQQNYLPISSLLSLTFYPENWK